MSRAEITGFLASALAVVVLSASVWAQAPGQQVVLDKCVKCHNTGRICKALGTKDKSAWETTVARMVKHGASLTPEEQAPAAAYLAGLPAGSKPLCAE